MRIMISSTAKDLPEYREAVINACRCCGFDLEVMEDFPASDSNAVDASLKMVDECDIYLGIFAYRYGHVPEGCEKSITEMEYDRGVELGKSRLIFLVDEDEAVSFKKSDYDRGEKEEKLEGLKKRLKNERVTGFFTSPETLAQKVTESLVRELQEQVVRSVPERPTHNLVPNDPFFLGRDDEIEDIISAWKQRETRCRLISILGPGGVGKTELAIHLGRALLGDFNDAGKFVDLSDCANVDQICEKVGKAFEVRLSGSTIDNTIQLAEMLNSYPRLLLVLDNLEQCVSAAGETLGLWTSNCENLLVIATSRETLNVEGEFNFHLLALDEPPSIDADFDTLRENESIRVFEEFANRKERDFRVTPENIQAIAKICEEVEYYPFYLKMIAQNIKTHEPEEMLEDLDDLKRTVWPSLEMTYRGLSENLRHILLQMSIFKSSFDRAAAKAVLRFDSDQEVAVSDVIATLCDTCFVRGTRGGTGRKRFSFYNRIVRDFVNSKQGERYEEKRNQTASRWIDYYKSFLDRWSAKVYSSSAGEALANIAVESENLFAIHKFAIDQGDIPSAVKIILNLAPAIRVVGPVNQCLSCLEKTESHCSDPLLRAKILVEIGHCRWSVSDWKGAMDAAQEAVELSNIDIEVHSAARLLEGKMHYYQESWDLAKNSLEESLEHFERSGRSHAAALALATLGAIKEHSGSYKAALDLKQKTLNHAIQSQSPAMEAMARNGLGLLAWHFGFPGKALLEFQRSRVINDGLGDRNWIAGNLTNISLVLADLGRFEESIALIEQAGTMHLSVGNRAWATVNLCSKARTLLLSGKFNEALDLATRSEKDAEVVGYAESSALCAFIGSRALFRLQQYEQAEVSVKRAIDYHVEKQHELAPRYWMICVLAAKIYSKLDNSEDEQRYREQAYELKEKLALNEESESIDFQEFFQLNRNHRI